MLQQLLVLFTVLINKNGETRMKTRTYFFIFFIIFSIIISGCKERENTIDVNQGISYQFDIYYSFGVGEKNILDTKNNVYVKDMICEPSIEYSIQLSDEEKTRIYNSITENDLLNVKDDFTENCDENGICQSVDPTSTATLKIMIDGKTKTIKWSENYIAQHDQELKKFQNVVKVIQEILSQKEKDIHIEQQTKCGYI